MDPTLQAIVYAAALVCWLLAAAGVSARVGLVPLGLAFAILPALWRAVEAT